MWYNESPKRCSICWLDEIFRQSEIETEVSNEKRVTEKWISYWSRFKLRNNKRLMIRSSLNSRNLDSDAGIQKNYDTFFQILDPSSKRPLVFVIDLGQSEDTFWAPLWRSCGKLWKMSFQKLTNADFVSVVMVCAVHVFWNIWSINCRNCPGPRFSVRFEVLV